MTKPWVTTEQVKEGATLKADDGFDCIKEGAILEVKIDANLGEPYVQCSHGKHFLSGQLELDHYVGFWLVPDTVR